MKLSETESKNVLKVLKRKLLKDSPRYQMLKKVAIGCAVSLGALGCSAYFLDGSLVGSIANVLIIPVNSVVVACSLWMGICNHFASEVIKCHISTLESMFANYDDLMASISDEPVQERKDNMNEVIGYTKEGNPIFDVPYVEVPEGEESSVIFKPYEKPAIIDVEYYPVEEVTLADKIILLMEYVKEVAYPNFEADMMVLDTMHEYVMQGNLDDLVKTSLENALHMLELNIFNQACKKYDLPLVRKLG